MDHNEVSRDVVIGGEEHLRALADHIRAAVLAHSWCSATPGAPVVVNEAIQVLDDVAEGRRMEVEKFLDPLIALNRELVNAELREETYPVGDFFRAVLRQFPAAFPDRRHEWILEVPSA